MYTVPKGTEKIFKGFDIMMMFKIRVRALATLDFPSCKEMINSEPGVVYSFMPMDFLVKAPGTAEAKNLAIEKAEKLFPKKSKFLTAKCIEVFTSEEEAWQCLS